MSGHPHAPPPKVALYIDSLKLGGAERITLTLARWLYQAGWAPVILTRRPRTHDFYPLPAGVQRAVEPEDPPWLHILGWWGFPWRVLRLRNWLRNEQVKVAIGITTLPAIKLLLSAHPLGIPCVISERNYPPAKPPSLPWRVLRRLSYPWAVLHIVQTRLIGKWLAEHLHATPQLLLPNPVQWPLPRFDPAPQPEAWLANAGVTPGAPVLLAAGTKSHQKGFDRLVAAFALLAFRFPDLQLVILGLDSGTYHGVDQQGQLRSLLGGDAHIQGRLHLPGRVGNIAEWYERASIFVLSSRYEGFPNVLLEAMAAGCPCLAFDCPTGPADLIHHRHDGWLLPGDASPREAAEALRELLEQPELRRRLGTKARGVRTRFSETALRDRFITAVEELDIG